MWCASLSAQEVVYGGRESDPYHLNLLKLALSYHNDKTYKVKQYDFPLPKQRAFVFLAENQRVDVLSASATAERLKNYRAIHVPLYKGLKGWRLAIINKKKPNLLQQVTNKQQLTLFQPVQFHSWIASKVLEHNDITVVKGSKFKGLFEMLDKNRADYLPRSILEVERDLLRYPKLQLMVDTHILIKYPSVTYFFVNKDNVGLAKNIEDGLEQAIKDGSFDRIFTQAFAKVIEQYHLKDRQIIELENPFYINAVELNRSELWVEHWLKVSLPAAVQQ